MEKERDGGIEEKKSSEESLGKYLKKSRQERGITLKEVEEATKIRVRYLQALEEEDLASLPGEVYARGFLRNYGKYLGIPPDELNQRYQAIVGDRKNKEPIEPKKEPTPNKTAPPRLLLIGGIMAGVVLAGFLLFSSLTPGEPVPEGGVVENNGTIDDDAGEKPVEEEVEEKREITVLQDTERTAEFLLNQGPILLEVRVEESNCWVRVLTDGQIIEEGTLSPGMERFYRAEKDLEIIAGNPGALFLTVDDQELGQAGRPGIPKEIRIGILEEG